MLNRRRSSIANRTAISASQILLRASRTWLTKVAFRLGYSAGSTRLWASFALSLSAAAIIDVSLVWVL